MGSGAMDYSTRILKIIYFLWCFGSLPDMDSTHMCVHAQKKKKIFSWLLFQFLFWFSISVYINLFWLYIVFAYCDALFQYSKLLSLTASHIFAVI